MLLLEYLFLLLVYQTEKKNKFNHIIQDMEIVNLLQITLLYILHFDINKYESFEIHEKRMSAQMNKKSREEDTNLRA